MFLDVKELAVRKLRIRKTYAPGSIDFHSAEIKQLEPLEVTATAELLESQIRIEGNLETKIELVCARCLSRWWKRLPGRSTCFTPRCPRMRSRKRTG